MEQTNPLAYRKRYALVGALAGLVSYIYGHAHDGLEAWLVSWSSPNGLGSNLAELFGAVVIWGVIGWFIGRIRDRRVPR